MNWKDDNLVIQSKTVKNSEPVTFMDSPRLSKGDTDKIRNGKVLSHTMDHEVQVEVKFHNPYLGIRRKW
jgi:hypothetical protein